MNMAVIRFTARYIHAGWAFIVLIGRRFVKRFYCCLLETVRFRPGCIRDFKLNIVDLIKLILAYNKGPSFLCSTWAEIVYALGWNYNKGPG